MNFRVAPRTLSPSLSLSARKSRAMRTRCSGHSIANKNISFQIRRNMDLNRNLMVRQLSQHLFQLNLMVADSWNALLKIHQATEAYRKRFDSESVQR